LLFANFDTRPQTVPANAWHLYDDDRPLRAQLHRVGFEPVENLDCSIAYAAMEPHGWRHAARGIRDGVFLHSSARVALRGVKRHLVALRKA
jgi:hypothetical protein